MLQATPVLDTLYIYSNAYDFDSRARSKRLMQLYNKIEQFPRALTDCEIDLE